MSESPEILYTLSSPYVFQPFEKFQSYDEIEQRILEQARNDFVNFVLREKKTPFAEMTIGNQPVISAALKYSSCRFTCIYGVVMLTSAPNIPDAKTHLFCPCHVEFGASKCGKYLIVTSVCNNHNHAIERCRSNVRCFLPEVQEEVDYLLAANITCRKIADYVHVKTGVRLTTKDFNVMRKKLADRKDVHDPSKLAAISQRIKEFIIFSSDILEKSMSEGSRVESASDVESTTGSSFTTSTHDEATWQLGEQIESIHYDIQLNEIQQSPMQSPQTSDLSMPCSESLRAYYQEASYHLPSFEILAENIIIDESAENESCIENGQFGDEHSNDTMPQQAEDYANIVTTAAKDDVCETFDHYDSELSETCLRPVLSKTRNENTTNTHKIYTQSRNSCKLNRSRARYKHRALILQANKRAKSILLNCSSCGVNARIVQAQLEVLRAQKHKLRQEIQILKLKKKCLVSSSETHL